jgi:hypothetical protein
MWEPIKKLEEIQQLNDNIFKRIDELFGFGKKAEQPSVVNKYKQSIDSGEECKAYGTTPNNLFWSEVGSKEAWIGKNKNHVNDITEFISKRDLRCYDLKKDPYKIAWLFSPDTKFEAEKIWGEPSKRPGEIYFKGTWKGGDFKGLWVEGSKFEGGLFSGKKVGDTQPEESSKVTRKPFTINIQPGLEFHNLLIELLDSKEVQLYNKIVNDINSGKFESDLKKVHRMIRTGELDGYGNLQTLSFLFPQKGTNSLSITKEEAEPLYELILFKKIIIDNIIKKDGTPNVHFQNAVIKGIKSVLGINIAQVPKTQATQTATTAQKVVSPAKAK